MSTPSRGRASTVRGTVRVTVRVSRLANVAAPRPEAPTHDVVTALSPVETPRLDDLLTPIETIPFPSGEYRARRCVACRFLVGFVDGQHPTNEAGLHFDGVPGAYSHQRDCPIPAALLARTSEPLSDLDADLLAWFDEKGATGETVAEFMGATELRDRLAQRLVQPEGAPSDGG